MESKEQSKSYKGMTPQEIVESVRSGKIKSCEYSSFHDYMKQVKKN